MLNEEGLRHFFEDYHFTATDYLPDSKEDQHFFFFFENGSCSYNTGFLLLLLLTKQEFILNHLYTLERLELNFVKR